MKLIKDITAAQILLDAHKDSQFIAIGELHNSRSAIKFIIDQIKNEFLANDTRKTYFLTEFLPPGVELNSKGQQCSYHKCKTYYIKAKNKAAEYFDDDSKARELDKSSKEYTGPYKLFNLYHTLTANNIILKSIEVSSTYANAEGEALNEQIKAGNLTKLEERTNALNDIACTKAKAIWGEDPKARVIFFAGMSHTADIEYVKYDDSGNELETKQCPGIASRLRAEGYNGISIDIHDPALCEDAEYLSHFPAECDSYTRFDRGDEEYKIVTYAKPDHLFFLDTPEHTDKKISNGFDSIFLPGRVTSLTVIQDEVQRRQLFAEPAVPIPLPAGGAAPVLLTQANAKKKKKKKKKKDPSNIPENATSADSSSTVNTTAQVPPAENSSPPLSPSILRQSGSPVHQGQPSQPIGKTDTLNDLTPIEGEKNFPLGL